MHGITRERLAVGIALLALAAITVAGAAQLAFLCDDAFIHFRYVANARAGHGLVWNAPPFLPVEGAGFLWPLSLWATWSWLGVEPPRAANVLSIALGVLQLGVLATAALRLRGRDGSRVPAVVGLTALAVIVTNRTFLQWLTGGLDTALFVLPFLAWALLGFVAVERQHARWLAAWSACAALAALARPDGLMLAAATAAVAGVLVWRRRLPLAAALAGAAPLLAVVAHVAWRRWFYGDWLPNTWHAKVTQPWLDAGLRYVACFALENGAWLWPPIVALWLAVVAHRGGRAWLAAAAARVPAIAAVAVVLAHAGYYVLRVGGDHFEYRVLAQLVPLGVLACVAATAQLARGVALPIATALALGAAGTFGWWHWTVTSDLTSYGLQTLTPRAPALLRPVTRWFDRQQLWLFSRYIGLRCRFHACVLHQNATLHYPNRLHVDAPPDPFPLMAGGAIGYLGWQLRDVAVLDLLGLNDWVIARTPVPPPDTAAPRARLHDWIVAADADGDGFVATPALHAAFARALADGATGSPAPFLIGLLVPLYDTAERPGEVRVADALAIGDVVLPDRLMAHEHVPPAGYVEALAPNVGVENGVAIVRPRAVPMTEARLRAIEAEWRRRIRTGQLGP